MNLIDRNRAQVANFSVNAISYFVTVTLDPFYTNGIKNDCIVQLMKTKPMLTKICNDLNLSYIFVAELTEKANIHYHGIVKIPDKTIKLLLSNALRKLGRMFKIDKIVLNQKSIDTVKGYITKDMDITYSICKKPILLSNAEDPSKRESLMNYVKLFDDSRMAVDGVQSAPAIKNIMELTFEENSIALDMDLLDALDNYVMKQ